jgi:hypothetical protein
MEDTINQIQNAWKQGMVEEANDGVGSQVWKTFLFTKHESDSFTKKFKTQGKYLWYKS